MSEVAALIADMVRAGVDPELIGRTAAALSEREAVLIPDEAAERRRAKDRERKRLRNSAEVGGVRGTSRAPAEQQTPEVSFSGSNPTTPKKDPPIGGPKKAPTSLPNDWQLPAEWAQWAVEHGLPPERIQLEARKMHNWSVNAGAKGRKLDWFRAWQNWVAEAVDRLQPARAGPAKPITLADRSAQLAVEFANVREIRPSPSSSSLQPALPDLSIVSGGRGGG